jgi:addiction module HigA family antidote
MTDRQGRGRAGRSIARNAEPARRKQRPGYTGVFVRHTPVHPGRFLESRFLVPLGISQLTLARELGVSRRRINELIQGRRGVTPNTALRLAEYFGTDATFWLQLQVLWDLHHARRSPDRISS